MAIHTFPTSPRGIVWCLIASSLAIPALAAPLMLATPSFHAGKLIFITATASPAVLAAICGVWHWRTRAATRGAVASSSALLAAGWGSIAWYAAEELRAGQDLPVINLLVFLVPLGLALAVAAQVVQYFR